MKARFAAIVLLVVAARASAQPERFPVRVAPAGGTPDHYCGLYCVYQAGQLAGRDTPLDSLIGIDRLSGKYGSTLGDLCKCCRDYGIPHYHLTATSYYDAVLIDRPCIVLLKGAPDAPVAKHWVLILGADSDAARVYDPAYGTLRMTAGELQSLWGGPMVVVAPGGADGGRAVWHVAKAAVIAVAFFMMYFLLRALANRVRHKYLVLALAVSIPATVSQALDGASFTRNGSVLNQMAAGTRPTYWTTPEELLGNPSGTVIVDVRTEEQYRAFAIPNAINIPYHSSFWKNRDRLEAFADGVPMVLYCNSSECGWAESMSRSALFQRFPRVSVLRGGLADYIEAKGGAGGKSP